MNRTSLWWQVWHVLKWHARTLSPLSSTGISSRISLSLPLVMFVSHWWCLLTCSLGSSLVSLACAISHKTKATDQFSYTNRNEAHRYWTSWQAVSCIEFPALITGTCPIIATTGHINYHFNTSSAVESHNGSVITNNQMDSLSLSLSLKQINFA